jgi:serine/threonine-protein kinase RsbT
MHWEIVGVDGKQGLRLAFADQGPGIPNMDLAMTDGWTSGKGLGMGLTGAKRLVNEFEIESKVGAGTRVTITRWK